jgi:hypothetical protein
MISKFTYKCEKIPAKYTVSQTKIVLITPYRKFAFYVVLFSIRICTHKITNYMLMSFCCFCTKAIPRHQYRLLPASITGSVFLFLQKLRNQRTSRKPFPVELSEMSYPTITDITDLKTHYFQVSNVSRKNEK